MGLTHTLVKRWFAAKAASNIEEQLILPPAVAISLALSIIKGSEHCEWEEAINYCERRAHQKQKLSRAEAYDECGPNDLQSEHGQLWNALVPALVNWSCGLNGSFDQLGTQNQQNTQQWRMPSGHWTPQHRTSTIISSWGLLFVRFN